jgi:cell division septation protein DedD
LILIFLAGVAVCGVFFSLGFLVGFNERLSHSAPPAEVVTAPSVIPPAVNPPAENVTPTPQGPSAPLNPSPDASLNPPASGETHPAEPGAKKSDATSPSPPPEAPADAKAKPETPPPPLAAGEVGEGVTLQVAALRTKPDAENLVAILKGRGYPVFMVTPEYAHADDNLFRVQVGPFRTREDAEKVRAKLGQEGFKPFIRH